MRLSDEAEVSGLNDQSRSPLDFPLKQSRGLGNETSFPTAEIKTEQSEDKHRRKLWIGDSSMPADLVATL